MRPLFIPERVAASTRLFLDGLLGDERRKTGRMRDQKAWPVRRRSREIGRTPCSNIWRDKNR